uniref:Vacuolar protein-sorting-associated protein 37 2 n=1 Tax=Anthurium amnicola TaxID=1678845 RepID=A0A1D1Z4V4_9ARAE
MSWKLPFNWMGGAQEQQMQADPAKSSYPPSVTSLSLNTPGTSTPGSASSVNLSERNSRPKSPSLGQPSPAEAAGIISRLKDKSIDELRAILTNKDAYATFFHSLDEVKVQNNLREELRKETLHLAPILKFVLLI